MAERQEQESCIIKRMKNIKTQGGINSTVTKRSPLDEQQEGSHVEINLTDPEVKLCRLRSELENYSCCLYFHKKIIMNSDRPVKL